MLYKMIQIGLMVLMIATLSCGNSDIKVKSNKTSSPQTSITTPQLEDDWQSIVRTPMSEEIEVESLANTNHVFVIGQMCSHYLISYGTIPDTLDELLDGFAFLWPESIYTGMPMKILDSKPDRNNPDDIGGVYYDQHNYYFAKIHFLEKIPSDSKATGYEWFESWIKVFPHIGWDSLNKIYHEATFLTEMTPEERMWYGYQRGLQVSLPFIIHDCIDRRSYVENNILDLLNASQYYILRSGYNKLKSGLNVGALKFDIGSRGDMEHFYFYVSDFYREGNYIPVCFEMLEDGSRSDLVVDCPEFDLNKAYSFFNSDDFNTFAFPDEVFITKNDVL